MNYKTNLATTETQNETKKQAVEARKPNMTTITNDSTSWHPELT
jgi:hypothetical protein